MGGDVTVNPKGNKRATGSYVSDRGSASNNRRAIKRYVKRNGGSRKFSTRLGR